MSQIKIEKPTKEKLKELGVENWCPWQCEPSTFDWEYADTEIAYIIEGSVDVETDQGMVSIAAGDLVTFPAGLKCVWHVKKPIRKVYTFQ